MDDTIDLLLLCRERIRRISGAIETAAFKAENEEFRAEIARFGAEYAELDAECSALLRAAAAETGGDPNAPHEAVRLRMDAAIAALPGEAAIAALLTNLCQTNAADLAAAMGCAPASCEKARCFARRLLALGEDAAHGLFKWL